MKNPLGKISPMVLTGLLLAGAGCGGGTAARPVHFAVFADIQYADQDDAAGRHYRRSVEWAAEMVQAVNRSEAEFVIGLGDLVDHGLEEGNPALEAVAKLKAPLRQVAGNHDFSVPARRKNEVYRLLGMPSAYYRVDRDGWTFLFLDTNVVSTYAYADSSTEQNRYGDLIAREYPFALPWDGGFGQEQLQWAEEEIALASRDGRRVVVFCHAPVYPDPAVRGGAVDAPAFLELLERYPDTVRLVLSGHHHPGDYFRIGICHFLTVRGQVEADSPTYALVTLDRDSIRVEGFGSQESHHWPR